MQTFGIDFFVISEFLPNFALKLKNTFCNEKDLDAISA